jgi:hypothetical protein
MATIALGQHARKTSHHNQPKVSSIIALERSMVGIVMHLVPMVTLMQMT